MLDLDIPRANPLVRNRVNSVNAMLNNAACDMRTRVHPDCRELITDFQEITWKQGFLTFEPDNGELQNPHPHVRRIRLHGLPVRSH